MKHKKTYFELMQERGETIPDYECPTCGWNAIPSEKSIDTGCCEVIDSQETQTAWGPGYELHIKCVCPVCNTEFEYNDGSP